MNRCTTVKNTWKGSLKQDARGPTEPRRDPGERESAHGVDFNDPDAQFG